VDPPGALVRAYELGELGGMDSEACSWQRVKLPERPAPHFCEGPTASDRRDQRAAAADSLHVSRRDLGPDSLDGGRHDAAGWNGNIVDIRDSFPTWTEPTC
jgi:hypothetical protein